MVRLLLLVTAWAVAGCSPSKPEATDTGVCWRVRAPERQPQQREVLERGIANLQTCAARLEAVRMMEGKPVEGAFEGRSIFVTEAEITQAVSRGGTRYPVFEPAEREAVQRAIRKLLDARSGSEAPPRR
ncbi:MAG: hypothetical protein KY446_09395 [Proteobacteria bacterium]|nr:hypothetical protein [Pseudomonadota bacterium]